MTFFLILLFVFPVLLITLLSLPLFLWIKNNTQKKLVTYIISSFFLAMVIVFSFLIIIILIIDNPIAAAPMIILVVGCYSILLGLIAWLLCKHPPSR